MVLGLVEGAEIVFLRRSLGGDPLEIRIYGAAISLRDEQARRFHVVTSATMDAIAVEGRRGSAMQGAVANGRSR
jgi:hypothetical protein